MSRWEYQDDSSTYGSPTIAQIKANPNVINWNRWDTVMTNPPDGSDYWWETPPNWKGNARTLFSNLKAANMRVILVLCNRDDQNRPSWSPNPPKTSADWNVWWEHVFATICWLDVRNNYNVTDFEILNEPNIPHQGWAPQANEAEYFTLAKYTYDAISYVFHTFLPDSSYHVYAPTTSGGTWPKDALRAIPQYFDSMDFHAYGNFRAPVEEIHTWMKEAGYTKEPLWVSEWGSYQGEYDSETFGIELINRLIYGSYPGNDYVYGSIVFAMYDFSKNPTGLIDYNGNRRKDYYAVRMGIRALQGCRSTYQSTSSNKDLIAITTVDKHQNIYLLVTNQDSKNTYKAHINLSTMISNATGIMWQFDSSHLDTVIGKPSIKNGNVSLVIPASGAILVKFPHIS